MSFINTIIKLFNHNWINILYINIKFLPIKQAIKLPIDISGRIRIISSSGNIIINEKKLERGLIRIGGRGSEMFPNDPFILDLKGTIIFRGQTELGRGCLLRVEENGQIVLGNSVRIGAKTKIFCENYIEIGNEVDVSWECQLFDTNFHYILNPETNDIFNKTDPIKIGNLNWIGNRVNIMKGTIIKDNIIVASNSLCNKDYSDLPAYSIIAGSPAKFIKDNSKRLFEGIDI